MLTVTGVRQTCSILTQLSLPLKPQRPTVVRMVPGHRYAYLNYGVYDAFKTVPSVAGAATRLERRGIFVLGQLVQMSENDLRGYGFMSDEIISDMKAHLATVKLGFGMRAPAWNRSFTSLSPAP
ncbi:hypothetical protein [Bradyrhizobium quebecense]|uniref:Uncharacterized protein n=2 Tax=Bradyrhizobium quebecense TaxID=2748629 RepID=A0ACD3VLL7_9BRAD|nr:hypothetical protein [Bradyrhizobium quebecense]UGY07436.1 hypothetical protein J4P68_0040390 [Bradyrhizobium quebecense]